MSNLKNIANISVEAICLYLSCTQILNFYITFSYISCVLSGRNDLSLAENTFEPGCNSTVSATPLALDQPSTSRKRPASPQSPVTLKLRKVGADSWLPEVRHNVYYFCFSIIFTCLGIFNTTNDQKINSSSWRKISFLRHFYFNF